MQKDSAMSYKQLFLLILTIWSAEICTRVLFDMLIPPTMEYRVYYLDKDAKGMFKGANIDGIGSRGWEMVNVVPNPDDADQVMVFLQRRTLLAWPKREKDD